MPWRTSPWMLVSGFPDWSSGFARRTHPELLAPRDARPSLHHQRLSTAPAQRATADSVPGDPNKFSSATLRRVLRKSLQNIVKLLLLAAVLAHALACRTIRRRNHPVVAASRRMRRRVFGSRLTIFWHCYCSLLGPAEPPDRLSAVFMPCPWFMLEALMPTDKDCPLWTSACM